MSPLFIIIPFFAVLAILNVWEFGSLD